jgi:hypothetical protein
MTLSEVMERQHGDDPLIEVDFEWAILTDWSVTGLPAERRRDLVGIHKVNALPNRRFVGRQWAYRHAQKYVVTAGPA